MLCTPPKYGGGGVYIYGYLTAASHAVSAALKHIVEKASSYCFQRREPCAAIAARFSVATVVGGCK